MCTVIDNNLSNNEIMAWTRVLEINEKYNIREIETKILHELKLLMEKK
jgi:hypothetical protein